MEAVLAEEQGDADDHASAAQNAKDKQEQLKVSKPCRFSYFFPRVNY